MEWERGLEVRGTGSPAKKAGKAAGAKLEKETVGSAISEMVESRRKMNFF